MRGSPWSFPSGLSVSISDCLRRSDWYLVRNLRALGENALRESSGAPDLSWCYNEDLLPLAAAFVVAHGRSPFKREVSGWMLSFGEFLEAGISAETLTAAYSEMVKEELSIGRPGSVLSKAWELHQNGEQNKGPRKIKAAKIVS